MKWYDADQRKNNINIKCCLVLSFFFSFACHFLNVKFFFSSLLDFFSSECVVYNKNSKHQNQVLSPFRCALPLRHRCHRCHCRFMYRTAPYTQWTTWRISNKWGDFKFVRFWHFTCMRLGISCNVYYLFIRYLTVPLWIIASYFKWSY